MKQSRKGMLMAALICGTIVPVLFGGTSVYAEEKDEVDAALQGFTLDQIVVTATRTEKRDVDVPADTETYTAADIKAAGGTNVHEVLSRLPGSVYESFGPHGSSMGTMSNAVLLRGYDNGTLVMLNGSPITGRQLYFLEAIPSESIERIEIVKGGGSVLYGSEAVAGVVNIITKKKGNNYVKAGIGSNLRRTYGVGVGDEKFNVYYDGEKMDRLIKRVSVSDLSSTSKGVTTEYGKTRTDVGNSQRHDAGIRYNINKNLSLNYNYFQNKSRYARTVIETTAKAKGGMAVGDPFNYRDYTTKQHVASLNYDDKTWKADLYINTGTIESYGYTWRATSGALSNKYYNTKERNRTIGASVQRRWDFGNKSNAIVGLDYKREHFQKLDTPYSNGEPGFNRNIFAVYGQWDHKFDAKNELILGARETWTTGSFGGENYSNFSASAQYVHKLDDNQSFYASIAQSFVMPTLKAMYSAADDNFVPNPNLKPQKGIHYELGWKKVAGVHNWKAALYAMRVKDNISASWEKKGGGGTFTYENEEYRNYGFEFGDTVRGKGKFTYNWAINWMNPEVKSDKNDLTKDWDRKYGKFQLTAGIGYHVGKFNANLSGSYLAGRVQKPSASRSYHVSPYLLTTLTANYAPDKNSEFSLTIDNLLDRDDIVSHSSSSYYSAPINFLFEYKYKF